MARGAAMPSPGLDRGRSGGLCIELLELACKPLNDLVEAGTRGVCNVDTIKI